MAATYLLNAFSLNMLSDACESRLSVRPCELAEARAYLVANAPWGSAVGHAETARLFAQALELDVPCRRETVYLMPYDSAVVGQYSGPRLPEGATELPAGARIAWFIVEVQ